MATTSFPGVLDRADRSSRLQHRFVRRDVTSGPAHRLRRDLTARLQEGVDLLPRLVPGCDHASVSTVTGRRLRVRVASDGTARRADELQDVLEEGPCLQAVRTGHSVVGHDLHTETRWLDWCSWAVDELEIASVLSVLLPAPLPPHTTLNLYAGSADGLGHVDLAHLQGLTAPLVRALLDEHLDLDLLGPAA